MWLYIVITSHFIWTTQESRDFKKLERKDYLSHSIQHYWFCGVMYIYFRALWKPEYWAPSHWLFYVSLFCPAMISCENDGCWPAMMVQFGLLIAILIIWCCVSSSCSSCVIQLMSMIFTKHDGMHNHRNRACYAAKHENLHSSSVLSKLKIWQFWLLATIKILSRSSLIINHAPFFWDVVCLHYSRHSCIHATPKMQWIECNKWRHIRQGGQTTMHKAWITSDLCLSTKPVTKNNLSEQKIHFTCQFKDSIRKIQ